MLTRTVVVRFEPGEQARGIGAIAVDTRVGWTRTATAKGCAKPWVEITPRGWVCGDYLATSTKPILGREVPMLERGELVPGIYGKVTVPNSVTYVLEKPKPARKPAKDKPQRPITSPAQIEPGPEPQPKMVEGKPLVGSINVRQYEELTIAGKTYWKVNQKQNEYVLRSAISPHRPSTYGGIRLGDETGRVVPVGFVWSRHGGGNVYTTRKPRTGIARQLAHKTPVTILETASDKAGKLLAYRIGDDEWLDAADARVFHPAPPPPSLLPGERWIDIDLENQILVAFEGDLAVYSTLISSGTKDTPTDPGVYRMWLKQSEADMNGLSGEDPYSVATVPWTQFFSPDKGLALHTAYWHDGFGTRRSHGCVNLAPRDARWLYFWSDPQVPAGWTSATGITEAPGSIVRVRTKDDPAPPAKGYAKKVLEMRQAGRG
ncbi:MAG: L,D-transpeptidase [Kofleriaceae bacterium]